MIYFMQPVGGGPVKIGFSDDVTTRHKMLEAHYGQTLVVLTTMDGRRDRESEIHDRFAHLRYGRTEQFRPAPELMDFIGKPLLVSSDPNAVEAMGFKSKSLSGRMIVNLRGTPEFELALLKAIRAAIKAGEDIQPEAINAYAELAIRRLALSHGITLPARMPPHGTNRHSKPKA